MAIAVFFTMAYNAEKTIRRTIDSVLNQTRGDFEYYILDNGSTDDTGEILYEYLKNDERIKPLRINKNDITNAGVVFSTLVYASTAKYIVWIDADDTYSPDFLEKMVGFAEENDLDVAACGYEKIDGITGRVLKRRALDSNLVVHGNLFVDEFITYRGFMSYLWGKLYSIPFMRDKRLAGTERKNRICSDSWKQLRIIKRTERFGVFGEAMYQYYQYPRSASRQNLLRDVSSYGELWQATKRYITSYGPVSKINMDFLYAIHLSLVEEAAENVFASELSADDKMKCLTEIFSDPVWRETLERDADPQFRNLAARGEFVKGYRERILGIAGGGPGAIDGLLKLLDPGAVYINERT